MTEAAVGFQCPECVAQGRQDVRVARTPFGGRVDTRAGVSVTLLGLCVAVFAVEWIVGLDRALGDWGMWPYGVAYGDEWWRLGTAMFLHVNLLHLLFNMYVLYLLGPQLERLLGHTRFLVLFLLAGFGGNVASFWFSDPRVVSAGASGAIFGLMAALVVVGHSVRADITQILVLIGINLAIGFVAGGIDWRAHLGGMVVGAAVAAIFAYAPRRGRTAVQVVGCVVVLAVLLGAAIIRAQDLTADLAGLTGRAQTMGLSTGMSPGGDEITSV